MGVGHKYKRGSIRFGCIPLGGVFLARGAENGFDLETHLDGVLLKIALSYNSECFFKQDIVGHQQPGANAPRLIRFVLAQKNR